MKVPGEADKNTGHIEEASTITPIAVVVNAFAPACYTPSWVPWLRWVGAACVVVILMITLHLVTGTILPTRLPLH
jgi:hypothetical protein